MYIRRIGGNERALKDRRRGGIMNQLLTGVGDGALKGEPFEREQVAT